MFEGLDQAELGLVQAQASLMRARGTRSLALVFNWLADGWLYGLVALALVALDGANAKATIRAAAAAVLTAHLLYPGIKSCVARPRPFERDPTIESLLPPLDRYSFPSGHCMTAAAAFLPVGAAHPDAAVGLLVCWLGIAWARVAAAHHYPTDLVAGALVGLAVSLAVTRFL